MSQDEKKPFVTVTGSDKVKGRIIFQLPRQRRFDWPLLVRTAIWLALVDWVFEWHRWLGWQSRYPSVSWVRVVSVLVLLTGATAIAIWVLGHRGVYLWNLILLVAWPIQGLPECLKWLVRILYRCIRPVWNLLTWLSNVGLIGKAVMMFVVVLLALVAHVTTSYIWVVVELVLLVLGLMLFLVGFMNIATRPLYLLEQRSILHAGLWGRARHWILHNKVCSFGEGAEAVGDFTRMVAAGLLGMAAKSALGMTDQAVRATRRLTYVTHFLGQLAAALVVSVMAIAGVVAAQSALLTPGACRGLADLPRNCVETFLVMAHVAFPERTLTPLSRQSLPFVAAVVVGYYLLVAVVLAFTIGASQGAREGTDEIRSRLLGHVRRSSIAIRALLVGTQYAKFWPGFREEFGLLPEKPGGTPGASQPRADAPNQSE
jgi:hypothetical protein